MPCRRIAAGIKRAVRGALRPRFLAAVTVVLCPGWAPAAVLQPDQIAAQSAQEPAPEPKELPVQYGAVGDMQSDLADLRALRGLEEDFLRAEIEGNASLADTVMADNYVGLRADGRVMSKSEVLSNLTRQQRGRFTVTATNLREHLFSGSACVTLTKVYTEPGKPNSYRENVLHFYTKQNGMLRLQVSTPLPSTQP